MTPGALMDDPTRSLRMDHRHGEAWGQIGTPDYPCFVGKPKSRSHRWLFVVLLLGAGVWTVLR